MPRTLNGRTHVKLIDRARIEGTEITIGRRVQYRDGVAAPSPKYAAEYRDATGRQVTESLKTRSRLEARKKALAIHARLQAGEARVVDARVSVDELVDDYFAMVKAKGAAPKTVSKYDADLGKLKAFAAEKKIALAAGFTRDQFYRFREWLVAKGYAGKTVYGVLTVTKQVFKWAWQEKRLRDYALATASLGKAKAKPQACFTTAQVESLIDATTGIERAAIATLAYAGLRIGELVQMEWSDVVKLSETGGTLHIRRGGSNGTTKDKDERFVPIHPRVRSLLLALDRSTATVFPGITERRFLKRVKALCVTLKFPNAKAFKLHSFRHHFASLCANHRVAERKALAWLGHSDSDILKLHYHLSDAESAAAMESLATPELQQATTAMTSVVDLMPQGVGQASPETADALGSPVEGESRASGQSRIERFSKQQVEQALTILFGPEAERGGFEPPVRV
jgi:site-specific recombinase XerD